MGWKSRGNWQIGLCLRGDCTNRYKKCEQCFRFSEYKAREIGRTGNSKSVLHKDSSER